ncbi:hypothetical protein OPKNFCMD_2001 [Methylobacterium crusticola]|uniref:Energy transducer TonB n=1 Tax=Methylobacterium crusticola TaxID=1697972 RepID=A0ABQ4QW51_9HYPH|nr:hypothetical protein [Methylobacterium crusticola]GJD49271.1 hypothetical protein OPKNFCMD_2001 [Methylobacterium crusticola]
MFSIGPFHRSAGQPAGIYASLLPLEPEPLDLRPATPRGSQPIPAAPGLGRHAVSMALLLGLTLAVQSAVGWWTLPGKAPALAPSAQGPVERAPS